MISPEGMIIAEWCLFSLALLLATSRIALHIRKGNRKLIVADIWLAIAMLDCLGLIICDTITYQARSLTTFYEAPLRIRKVRFATNYLFDFGLYFTKFSMLAFYLQIVPYTFPELRKGLYAVIGFVTCASLTTLFADTFWCGTNVSVNWSNDPNACSVFASMHLARMNWSLNFISEVLILLLPFPMIRGLNFRHRSEKIGLTIVFLLGGVTITVSTARFIGQLIVSNNIAIYILAMTEYTVAIMILSLISLRPLLRKLYRVATNSENGSPFSRSKTKTGTRTKGGATLHTTKWKGSRIYNEKSTHGRNLYGSEVELTEMEPGRIYKTEEISVTSTKEVDANDPRKDTPGTIV